MSMAPHDITDLHLAPVLLALDARLDELGRLDPEALSYRIALESNLSDRDEASRIKGVLESVGHLVNRHGWELTWHPRGVRVAHGSHSLVLGVPDGVSDYVAGPTAPASADAWPHPESSVK